MAAPRRDHQNAIFQGRSTLKAYELQGPGGVDAMALVEKPVPVPGPGQVLVKLKAATINYRDLLTVKGGYGSRQKFPLVPLSDGAGTVGSVGAGVTRFKPGDRVTGSFFEGWLGGEPSEAKMRSNLGGALDGVLCEYRLWPAAALVRTPEHLSDAEAASLLVHAARDRGHLVERPAGLRLGARDLLDEHCHADAAAARGVQTVLDRDVVVREHRRDVDALVLRHLRGELEVHDVARVVLDDVHDALPGVDRLRRREHLVRHRRGEHLAGARRVEHAASDEPAVQDRKSVV